MTLRSKRFATLRTILDRGHMLLNLRGHDLVLQARKERFALRYCQSHGGWRDFIRPLDDPQLVFYGTAWDRLKYQFDCPFHLQRLPLPTTLHTLIAYRLMARLTRPWLDSILRAPNLRPPGLVVLLVALVTGNLQSFGAADCIENQLDA